MMRTPWPRSLPLLFGLLLLLPSCGKPPGTADEGLDALVEQLQLVWSSEEELERTELLKKIGALARARPDTVIPDLVERLKTERVDPRFGYIELELDYGESSLDRAAQKADARAQRDVILARLQEHVEGRDTQVDFKNVDKQGIARLRLRVLRDPDDPEGSRETLAMLLEVVTSPGRLDLAPVVERPGAETGDGTTLWTGTAETYDAYLAEHTAALEKAIAEGDYTPAGEAPFQVAWRPPAERGGAIQTLMVYRPADRAERFTQDDVALAGKVDAASGRLVLELVVKPERREAMDAFLTRHQGRPLAVLVDYRTELVLPMPKDAEQLRYTAVGMRGDPRAEARLQRLVSKIRPGTLTRPVSGRIGSNTPQGLSTPLASALIMAGPAAKKPLEALLDGNDALARRAEWIRREIDRLERERPDAE